ncbi:MAG: TonB-dependent receptor, partial [Acidobacteriota bacterium]|nr:TonB-dependent receptor [Acidobacteriota bacterium]
MPTALVRQGNFSEFSSTLRDPLTGEPFAGNVVPNNRISPIARSFLEAYPLPTANILNPGDANRNFFSLRSNRETINNFGIKIDHRLTDNNSLTGRFNYQDLKRLRASFFDEVPAGFGNGDEFGDTRQITISDTHTFTPTVLNEFRFGYTKINISILNAGVGGTQGISETFASDVGIPNVNNGTFEQSGSILTGGFGNGFLEFAGDGGPFIVESQNPYFADTLTIIKGKHTIKTGGELRLRYLETIDGGRSGGLKGNLAYGDGGPETRALVTGQVCPAASTTVVDGQTRCFVDQNGIPYGGTGNAAANILLGVPAIQAFRGSNPGGPFHLRSQEYGLFVQDDWKATDSLTLNLGLRYDLFTPVTERDARLGNFDLDARRVVQASDSGDRLIETDKNNFGPRVGFAYAFGPDKNMVVRGGYGLLYTLDGVDYPPLIRNPPFTNSVAFDPFNSNSQGRSTFSLQTGPPDVPVIDPANIPQPVVVFFQEPEQKTASVHQFNLTYQIQFARNYSLDIGYVANRSRNLLASRNLGVGGTAQARNAAGQFIFDAQAYENRASSQYDGMQVQLQKRLSNNVQGQISYTWSHTIDDTTGIFSGIGDARGSRGGPINPFNFSLDRGNSSLDVRHLLSANAIIDLPFGKGQRFFNSNATADKLVGGLQLNVIVNARSGFPFSIGGEDQIGR